MEEYLTLGEICKSCGISAETLRRYEKAGLIRPAAVKERNRRFYSISQLPILKILCLGKDLGITPRQAKDALTGEEVGDYLNLIEEQKEEISRQRNLLAELEKNILGNHALLAEAEKYSSNPKIPDKKDADVTVYFPKTADEDLIPLLRSAELWTYRQPDSGQNQASRIGIAFSDRETESRAKKYLRDSEKIGFHGTFEVFSFRGSESSLEDFSDQISSLRPAASVWIRHRFTLCKTSGENEYFSEIYLV